MFDLLTAPGKLKDSLRYDYEEISPEHRETVKEAAIDIRQRTKRASDDILEIGKRLLEIKVLIPHGKFEAWAEDEFGMSSRTAQRLMMVADRFASKSVTVTLLSTSVLYLLASPSIPDEAIDATIAYAQQSDKPVTQAQAQAIIAEHRAARTASVRETEAVVWRAAGHGRSKSSEKLAWMATATAEDYATAVNPGIMLDGHLLAGCIAKVRGEIQRTVERESPTRATAPVVAKAVYMTPEPPPPPPPQEAVTGEIVENDEDDPEPELPPPSNRTNRLRYILSAYREALRLVPEYGDLTGCHSQGLQIRRVLEEGVKNLEGNLV